MKTVDTTVTTPQGRQTSVMTCDWHNVAVLDADAEVFVHPKMPLRIGYSISGSSSFGETDVSSPAPPGIPGHDGFNALYIAGSATDHHSRHHGHRGQGRREDLLSSRAVRT